MCHTHMNIHTWIQQKSLPPGAYILMGEKDSKSYTYHTYTYIYHIYVVVRTTMGTNQRKSIKDCQGWSCHFKWGAGQGRPGWEGSIWVKTWGNGVSHIDIHGKSVPGRWFSKCKGPEVGECLTFLKKTEANVARWSEQGLEWQRWGWKWMGIGNQKGLAKQF